MRIEKDFEELLGLFNRNNVKYCIVGAYAVGVYVMPRYTKDIDIFVEASGKNAEKIVKALNEFGMESLGLTKEDFTRKENIIQLGHEPVRIDIIMDIADCDFKRVWKDKTAIIYGKEKVYVIGLDDLMRSKKAAGRKIDEADLEKLLMAKRMEKERRRGEQVTGNQ